MKTVFADTLYWVAISRPNDSWRATAMQARRDVGEAILVTTDEVIIEFLTAMAKGGDWMRTTAARVVRAILVDPVCACDSTVAREFSQRTHAL
jgi:hypothetical protein